MVAISGAVTKSKKSVLAISPGWKDSLMSMPVEEDISSVPIIWPKTLPAPVHGCDSKIYPYLLNSCLLSLFLSLPLPPSLSQPLGRPFLFVTILRSCYNPYDNWMLQIVGFPNFLTLNTENAQNDKTSLR